MKGNKHSALSIFILILFFNAGAQTDVLSFLQAKVDSNNKTHLPEKLFLHTDKNFYSAGDIVWFKIYSFDGFLNKPLNLSKVAYVELLNDENNPVATIKVGMDSKGGDGTIQLPLNLASGYYTLRSYTNWMKNFGPEQFFSKKLLVFNPFKNTEQKTGNVSSPAVSIFPEGGNLVYGLSSKVAYRLSSPGGKGLKAKGYLVNDLNDTISLFSPLKFGLGSFDITPQLNRSYKLVFVFDDNSIIAKPITGIYEKGYSMNVEEDEKGRVRVTVRSNVQTTYPEIFMVASNRQLTKSAKRSVITNGVAGFVIDKNELGEGVSQITIFNSEKQPVCERLFFIAPVVSQPSLQSSNPNYGIREKVSLSISPATQASSIASLTVFQADSFQNNNDADIVSYLWLGSELNGAIENPGYYFSGKTPEVQAMSDLLMLTHGWRRFSWDKIINQNTEPEFASENSGQKIAARVIDTRNNKPAQGVQVYLSIPETKNKLYTGLTNEHGLVHFDVKDFYGPGEMVLQTNQQKDSFYKIELASPFSQKFIATDRQGFSFRADNKAELESYSISMQAQHIYREDSLRKFYSPEINDTFSFMGKPMYSYHLDNYSRFTTMEEVLREYVREINVGAKSGGNLIFRITNEIDRESYSKDTLVVVDGVPLFATDKVFKLDPLKYRQLEIITRNYVLGQANFHGLASFSSYQNNYADLDLDQRAIIVDYEGLQLQREFYSPVYQSVDQINSRIPDLRTTLFWSPQVDVNQPAIFYTGDTKGKFTAVLQGMDINGKPFSAQTNFEVK